MTNDYYNANAERFIENTINDDMTTHYKLFEKYLPTNASIIDIGFGSGRDSLYFSCKYDVLSIDIAEELIKRGRKILTNKVEL